MLSEQVYRRCVTVIVGVYAFSLPVFVPVINIILVVWLAFGLLARTENSTSRSSSRWVIIALLLFLYNALGLLITDDLANGLFNIQQKLPLLLVPLAFLLTASQAFKRRLIATLFICGCFIRSVWSLLVSWRSYQVNGDSIVFYYNKLSHDVHPAYLSMFLMIGILCSAWLWCTGKQKLNRLILLIIIVLFSIMIIMLQAKAAFLTYGLILIAATSMLLKDRLYKEAVVIVAGMSILFVVVQKLTLQPGRSRIEHAVTNIRNANSPEVTKTVDSSLLRLLIWDCSFSILRDCWYSGTGAGDVKHVLSTEYSRRGIVTAREQNLNAHNQFLQVSLAGGIPALFLLILYLAMPFRISLLRKDYLLMAILFTLLVNMMVESLLEAQWGISITAFFLALAVTSSAETKNPGIGTGASNYSDKVD